MFSSIGATADDVAATLRTSGIQGMPNTVGALNPIVKYAISTITVDAMMVDVIQGDTLTITYRDWRTEQIPLTKPIIEFLTRFHRGEYPDLIMNLATQ